MSWTDVRRRIEVFTEQQIVSSATASEIDMEAFGFFMRAQGKQAESELKQTLSDEEKAMEQLRWSLPYLDHLRSVCRIECGTPPRRVPAQYVVIGKKTTPYLAKQRVSGDHALPNVSHKGITIRRLVGSRLRFAWLKGDRT